jgi:protein-disulfide isomerase
MVEKDANEEVPAESDEQDDGVFHIKRSTLYTALLPLAFVTGLALGFVLWGQPTDAPIAQNPAATEQEAAVVVGNPTAPPSPPDLRSQQGQIRLEVSEDDDAVLGPDQAPITIIEFSDFLCPYCKRWHNESLTPLLERYPDEIRLIYRDFPVVGGFEAALAAECAGEQGDYYAYHDLLFAGEFEELNSDAFASYAEQLGMNSEDLLNCVEEGTFAGEVEADARYAAGLGVTGTPTFFINGIPLVGAQPIDAFVQIIEGELATQ